MREKFVIYIDRYRLLAEEMRDIVYKSFKPQVLQTIRVGQKLQLDVMRFKEENLEFQRSLDSIVSE